MLIFRGVTCTTCPPGVPQILTIIFKKKRHYFQWSKDTCQLQYPLATPLAQRWLVELRGNRRLGGMRWHRQESQRWKFCFGTVCFFMFLFSSKKKSVCLNCSFFLIETSSNPFLGIRLPLPCKWIGVVPERFLDGVCALFPLGALQFITEVFTTIVSPLLELLFSPCHQQSFCVLGCFFPTTISSWILWMPAYACYHLPAFSCWYVCLFWL